MSNAELDIVEIGRLGKPYGFAGAIHVYLNDGVEFISDPRFVFISIEGLPVPFEVITQGIHNGTITLILDEIDSKEGIEKFKNAVLSVESRYVSIEQSQSDELIGYTILDQVGTVIGSIVDVIEQEPLLFLKVQRTGTNQELILPYHSDLLIESNHPKTTLTLEIADGLLDL